MVGKKHTHIFQNCTSKSCLNGSPTKAPQVMTWYKNCQLTYCQLIYSIVARIKAHAGEESSETTVGGVQQVFKPGFTKLIKVHRFCRIVYRIVQIIHHLLGVQFVKLQVQFRHLLPQLGVPHLLEDVVGKDGNKCCKYYDDRGVPNCKLISS